MIRKWSYLKSTNIHLDNNNGFYCCALRYTFKVFRITTRFKRYNLGYTVMTRKKYSRRRRRTNWITLPYIIKYWVLFVFRAKQFIRFYQNIGLFNVQSYSANICYFDRRLYEINNFNGINSFSCSQRILLKFIFKDGESLDLKTQNFFNTPLFGNSSAGVMSRSMEHMHLSENIAPGLVQYDRLLYPYNVILDENEKLNYLLNLDTLSLTYVNSQVLAIYQSLVLLTLYVIKTK